MLDNENTIITTEDAATNDESDDDVDDYNDTENINNTINKNNMNENKQTNAQTVTMFAILTGSLGCHLPYIINHCECLNYFMHFYYRMIEKVLAFS